MFVGWLLDIPATCQGEKRIFRGDLPLREDGSGEGERRIFRGDLPPSEDGSGEGGRKEDI